MPIDILMPALSPTMKEGKLVKWHFKEGDKVDGGDILAEIETDKAVMDLEASDSGTLGKIFVEASSKDIAVGNRIAVLLEEGESASAIKSSKPEASAKVEVKKEEKEVKKEAKKEESPTKTTANGSASEVAAEKEAKKPTTAIAVAADQGKGQGRVLISPLARRLASESGVNIKNVAGTGPHGRIVKADIEQALTSGTLTTQTSGNLTAQAFDPANPETPFIFEAASTQRKVIAERLTKSKREQPHFYLTIDCDIESLMIARAKINNDKNNDIKISLNDFIIKAVASSMAAEPRVNVAWSNQFEGGINKFSRIDIAVAVATEQGLITPVLRDVNNMGVSTISQQVKALALKAREAKLMPHEYSGGGFTISNLGMYGIKNFQAVLNPPQSCIMAVGAGEKRAVIGENDQITVKNMMSVTLSVDHRAVDGAIASQFLQHFKKFIENPIMMVM